MRFTEHNTAKFKAGFSLIEMLVVVTIIGILATVALFAYDDYITEARDAQRIEDLKNISSALSLAMLERGSPFECLHGIKIEPGYEVGVDATGTSCNDAGEIQAAIAEYFGSIPHDPLGPGDDRFFYYFDGNHSCDPQRRADLMIFAAMEEQSNSNREEQCGMVGTDPATSGNNDGFYNYNSDVGRENYPYVIRIDD